MKMEGSLYIQTSVFLPASGVFVFHFHRLIEPTAHDSVFLSICVEFIYTDPYDEAIVSVRS